MPRRLRRNHTPAFKAQVALAAIKGDRTLPIPRGFFSVLITRAASFDHIVSECQRFRWNGEAQCRGGLEVDDKLKLGSRVALHCDASRSSREAADHWVPALCRGPTAKYRSAGLTRMNFRI